MDEGTFEFLLVLGGLAVVLAVVFIVMWCANACSVKNTWSDAFNNAAVGDSIESIIQKCGSPTEIVQNENGVHYLLTCGFVHREGEHADIGGCIRYSWIKQEFKGILRGGTQTRAMHYFVRDGKLVFWYGHNLDMPGW